MKSSIRINMLERRIEYLKAARGATIVDRNGDELFDVFDPAEVHVVNDALIKHYREEIDHLQRAERVMAL